MALCNFGLDIGTSKVSVLIADWTPQVQAIRQAVEQAERMADYKIRQVYTGIAGHHIRSLNSHGVVAIQGQEVTQEDIDRVIEAAQAVAIPADQRLLHILPQTFIIDHQDGIKEPIGMSGVRLEAKVHIVTGAISATQNIIKCVERSSSQAVLMEDEKELGVCLIDIGGGTTDISVFTEGAIRHTAVIPIAGDQVTNDIAVALRAPILQAEAIKRQHACALAELLQNEEVLIEVPGIGDRPGRKISKRALSEVVSARYEELFQLVKSELRRIGHLEQLAAGLVVTGGASNTQGCIDLAERIFKEIPVRQGYPHYQGNMASSLQDGRYATGVGPLFYGYQNPVPEAPINSMQAIYNRMKSWNMHYENQGTAESASHNIYDIDELKPAIIKVIGVGGGGGNALEHMISHGIEGVEFICANTDAQGLKNSHADVVLQLGDQSSRGLGAGANPEVGRKAAEASRERICSVLDGADMVFITSGMGGGTGTGAAPVVAEIAKSLRSDKSGKKRMEIAEEGIRQLSHLLEAFKAVNNVLLGAVQGISELITRPGLINVDFADVRTVMSEMGMAMMGTGEARGENRARDAAEAAITGPLLEDINLSGARGALVIITAGLDLSIGEFEEAGEVIKGVALEGATIVLGTVIDPEMSDSINYRFPPAVALIHGYIDQRKDP
ncbi:hypothetical protein DFH27DRAFT_632844 [Peziza echinospora]|nr:hypothetical protein DFH27DRAFT_632844 [Peziza echinospora]